MKYGNLVRNVTRYELSTAREDSCKIQRFGNSIDTGLIAPTAIYIVPTTEKLTCDATARRTFTTWTR